MAIKTATNLKSDWHEVDPHEQYEDTLESVPDIAQDFTTTMSGLFVHPGGGADADGSLMRPYSAIGDALAQIESDRKDIFVFAGTYNEHLDWWGAGCVDEVRLVGLGSVTIGDVSSGTAVLKFAPGTALGAAITAYVENVEITHAGTGLAIDNDACDEKVTVKCRNVSLSKSAGTSVIISHTEAGHGIELFLEGQGHEIGGKISFEVKNADDRLVVREMELADAIVTTNDNIAAVFDLYQCELPHDGAASGGSASQTINSFGCWSRNGKTLAAADTNEFAGNHSEVISP